MPSACQAAIPPAAEPTRGAVKKSVAPGATMSRGSSSCSTQFSRASRTTGPAPQSGMQLTSEASVGCAWMHATDVHDTRQGRPRKDRSDCPTRARPGAGSACLKMSGTPRRPPAQPRNRARGCRSGCRHPNPDSGEGASSVGGCRNGPLRVASGPMVEHWLPDLPLLESCQPSQVGRAAIKTPSVRFADPNHSRHDRPDASPTDEWKESGTVRRPGSPA